MYLFLYLSFYSLLDVGLDFGRLNSNLPQRKHSTVFQRIRGNIKKKKKCMHLCVCVCVGRGNKGGKGEGNRTKKRKGTLQPNEEILKASST